MLLPSLRHAVKALVTTLSAVCALITPVAGQTEPPPAVGARVRVVLPAVDGHAERYIFGRLFRLGGDSVLLLTGAFGARQDTLAFALSESGPRLERPVAGRSHGRGGAALGAVVGALTGAAIGSAAYRPCTQPGFFACIAYPSQSEETAAYAVLGGVGGALVGLMVGSFIRSETWVPVSDVSAHIMLAPGVVGIRLAF